VGTVIGRLHQPKDTGGALEAPQAAERSVQTKSRPVPRAEAPSARENIPVRKAKLGPTRSSPRARRKALELGIDWTTVEGSGRSGRIRERDVLAAATASAPEYRRAITSTSFSEGVAQAIPVDATRRAIAERMMQSAHGTAAVTLVTSIDATNLVNLRQQFKAVARGQADHAGPIVIGYTDIVIKLAALALERHPIVNSRWDGDRDQIVLFRGIHIGLAVDTEAGLLVPVLRDVPNLSLRQIATRAHDLIDRARRRLVKSDELRGGTFTVTNLGPFGIDAFTPIINFPQCALLGLGRILRQPVAVDQQLVVRDRMTLNLTFDHRIVDGAPAARFLQTLVGLLENPSPWLLP
jgi:pyruvate dehydrogenase E2 component (dihydrolipoamide acetyltransferase)